MNYLIHFRLGGYFWIVYFCLGMKWEYSLFYYIIIIIEQMLINQGNCEGYQR